MAHELASDFMGILENNPLAKLLLGKFLIVDNAPVETLGLKFPNVVGLAAGFDKDGRFPAICRSIGFGHMEVGTVTPRGQAGNPKPRLFQFLKRRRSLIVWGLITMGHMPYVNEFEIHI